MATTTKEQKSPTFRKSNCNSTTLQSATTKRPLNATTNESPRNNNIAENGVFVLNSPKKKTSENKHKLRTNNN